MPKLFRFRPSAQIIVSYRAGLHYCSLASAGLLIFGLVGGSPQGPASLSTLTPETVRALNPRQQVNPIVAPGFAVAGRPFKSAIQFLQESEVSYRIPVGQRTFSGVLFYRSAEGIRHEPDPKEFNRFRVTFALDGKQVFQAFIDHTTPPQEFSINLVGGQVLTVASDSEWGGGAFYLLDPTFSPEETGTFSRFILPLEQGYVDFMPEARQTLFHVYRPGETVPIQDYFRGNASETEILFRVTPEQGSQKAATSTVHVSLQQMGPDLVAGATKWKVPSSRGPATLEVEEQVNGRTVYERTLRIAIAPAVDLAAVTDSTFGVHLSSEGYPFLQDEFASLWGAKWGRVFLRWPVVEPNKRNYDFSRADQLVEIYRRQNMRILGVLGEDAPKWAGGPGPALTSDWREFVGAVVEHFRNKVDHWDIFNEVDVKFAGGLDAANPGADLPVLEAGLNAIRAKDPASKTVCCSTGTVDWLPYDRRLFNEGLLSAIDIVSLHPYQDTAPEEKEGFLNYLGELNALQALIHSYGASKSIWSTEANWLLGTPEVTVADEHTQAEYVVRVNLLSFSRGVPYFVHMPFFYSFHTDIHLDTLSAYANMAFLFSGATAARLLNPDPGLYFVTGLRGGSLAGALWSVHGGVVASLAGLLNPHFVDMYGNPISINEHSIALSSSPIYFLADANSSPSLSVITASVTPQWKALPALNGWKRSPDSRYEVSGGLHVTSSVSEYGVQLLSPPVDLEIGTCYVAGFDIKLIRGSLAIYVADSAGKHLGPAVHLNFSPDGQAHLAEVRFRTETERTVRVVIQDGNSRSAAVSEFEVSNPKFAPCH
jgi:glycosyl hydrolase family 10